MILRKATDTKYIYIQIHRNSSQETLEVNIVVTRTSLTFDLKQSPQQAIVSSCHRSVTVIS